MTVLQLGFVAVVWAAVFRLGWRGQRACTYVLVAASALAVSPVGLPVRAAAAGLTALMLLLAALPAPTKETSMPVSRQQLLEKFATRDGCTDAEDALTQRLRSTALHLRTAVPDGPDRNRAINSLYEALMWARAGLDRAPGRNQQAGENR